MNHSKAISKLIKSLLGSANHHAIIIEGPPGWGKTHSVHQALKESKVQTVQLGAYSTSLSFYNFLYENSDSDNLILIDDTSGLFNDPISMAILKAATWHQGGKRIIRWRTASSLAATPEFEFGAKFIIICNSFPNTPDGEAVKSRSFVRTIQIKGMEARRLLIEASQNKNWFPETAVATAVAKFLAESITDEYVPKVSFRTLELGYDLAKDHPDDWPSLIAPHIPVSVSSTSHSTEDPQSVIKGLISQNLKVKDQVRIFEEKTGFKRRTFFNYRNNLNIMGSDK